MVSHHCFYCLHWKSCGRENHSCRTTYLSMFNIDTVRNMGGHVCSSDEWLNSLRTSVRWPELTWIVRLNAIWGRVSCGGWGPTVVGELNKHIHLKTRHFKKVEMRIWLKTHVTAGKHLQMFAEDAWLKPERQHPTWVYLPPSCSQSLMNNLLGNCCTSANIHLSSPSLLHLKLGICSYRPSGGQTI